MIGLLFGNALRGVLAGPVAIFAGIAAITAICGCMRCMRCRLRDCACLKRFLRCTGHDPFDDFELMILVHEALFDRRETKLTTVVRVTAGLHTVRTDSNSNGIFQQPLHITVEQGTNQIIVDLLDSHDRVLATLPLDTMEHILTPQNLQPEMVYTMKQKGKAARNPKIKLTMVVSMGNDAEMALLSGMSSDVDILVRQQLRKAKEEGQSHGGEVSDMEVLKEACAGPLELFEGLGKTTNVYVVVLGPPTSRRWLLGIWNDKNEFDCKKHAVLEVDLLKIQSVQADPTRHHVFVVSYFDETRSRQTLTFRRLDRARDVWVEILHLLVTKTREARDNMKGHHARRTRHVEHGRSRGAHTFHGA